MNVVPAQVAGRRQLALASPAQREHGGLPHPTILAACALLGIDEVYAAGGAGAVAMFAYGYQHDDGGCAPVDLITGPANIYGVAAKRLLRGLVGIDSEAGPTEIAILADDSADPVVRRRRPDQPGRARHGRGERARHRPTRTRRRQCAPSSTVQVAATKHTERASPRRWVARSRPSSWSTTSSRASRSSTAMPPSTSSCTRATHASGPGEVRNAGAVFVGPYAPVSLGDYAAGSNHVLPTGGCACHSSGLSVRTFLKTVQVVDYSSRGAGRGGSATCRRWPRPRTFPAMARPSGSGSSGDRDRRERARACRCVRSWSGWSRTAPRSSTSPSGSTPTRTRTARRRAVQASIAEAVAAVGRRASTATPIGRPLRCVPTWPRYLGHGLTADQVWAANGSNEVMVQVLQAFGGPGRTCLSFAPTYSMYPEYARDTFTRWVAGARGRCVRDRRWTPPWRRSRPSARRRLPRVAEQPDRDRAATRHLARGARGSPRRGRRRRGVRGVPPRGYAVGAEPARRSTRGCW